MKALGRESSTMEAVPLRHLPTLPPRAPVVDLDWDAIYDDPDLAPYDARPRARKETPLSAWA